MTDKEFSEAFNTVDPKIYLTKEILNNKVDPNYYQNTPRATELQIGGNHYKKFKIQPAEFCYKNNIPYLEATAIKYLCRWKDKGGIQDLEKAKHFIDLLIEFEHANN